MATLHEMREDAAKGRRLEIPEQGDLGDQIALEVAKTLVARWSMGAEWDAEDCMRVADISYRIAEQMLLRRLGGECR